MDAYEKYINSGDKMGAGISHNAMGTFLAGAGGYGRD